MPQANDLELVPARATKRFFVEMLTRDIPLDDCVLELVDNAIDAHLKSQSIKLERELLKTVAKSSRRADVRVGLSSKEVSVLDDCGGISRELARTEVFNLGRTTSPRGTSLGVYGVGLKRAVFKLGDDIHIVSRTKDDAFEVAFRASEWTSTSVDDPWKLPLRSIDTRHPLIPSRPGTHIVVRDLHDDVTARIASPAFIATLRSSLAATYSQFLERWVDARVNDCEVQPSPLPVAVSEEIEPSVERLDIDAVRIHIVASVSEQDAGKDWPVARAGWYVLCNGRLVLSADKSEFTGWGAPHPAFHDKYRKFFGVAAFFSDRPEQLPWTTTKRNVNRDSIVFQKARSRMVIAAAPVLRYLGKQYTRDSEESAVSREVTGRAHIEPLSKLLQTREQTFSVRPKTQRRASDAVNVLLQLPRKDIERAAQAMGRSQMSARQVVRRAFDYYLENECS